LRQTGLLNLVLLWRENVARWALPMGKIKMGVQAGVSELGGAKYALGANFGAYAVHFVVYWAKAV